VHVEAMPISQLAGRDHDGVLAPVGANHCILAGMSWHRTPTDNAWKQAHLAMVEGLGKRFSAATGARTPS